MEKYIVKENIENLSVKDYLRKHLHYSGTLWKKIKGKDDFYKNDEKLPIVKTTVSTGDVIKFSLDTTSNVVPVKMDLEIFFEDEYLLVVGKRANILTHPLSFERENSVTNGVAYYLESKGEIKATHPIYRLDRNTSGLLIFAKRAHLQHLFTKEKYKIEKTYYALVSGIMDIKKGTVNKPIASHPDSRIIKVIDEKGKRAVTHYEVVTEFADYSLVKLKLDTGRTHQIRVHMASINHPLLGDDLYGGSREKISRQGLHCQNITFIHPITEEKIHLSMPFLEDMEKLIK